jgi:hypothetical protein
VVLTKKRKEDETMKIILVIPLVGIVGTLVQIEFLEGEECPCCENIVVRGSRICGNCGFNMRTAD